jgi:hypothetical protein
MPFSACFVGFTFNLAQVLVFGRNFKVLAARVANLQIRYG